jgi:hypothetical protein
MELNLTKYRNLGTQSILNREERRINGQIIIIIRNTQVISASSQNYTSLEIIFKMYEFRRDKRVNALNFMISDVRIDLSRRVKKTKTENQRKIKKQRRPQHHLLSRNWKRHRFMPLVSIHAQ